MKYIKSYKIFESDKSSILDKYVGTPLFCLRNNSLDCRIFTDKNLGGYGIGLRGDYFNEWEFVDALGRIGDSLNRHLFEINELNELAYKIKISGSKEELIDNIINKIKGTRATYVSADPEGERKAGVYVELDELRKLLMENN